MSSSSDRVGELGALFWIFIAFCEVSSHQPKDALISLACAAYLLWPWRRAHA